MKEFDKFVEVMRRVKTECPWDKKQTHQTLRQYLIEETFEVIDTIDEEDFDGMKEELGDVLIQIVFHSLLAQDKGEFTLEEVCETVSTKLISRHPHVFGDNKVHDAKEVLQNWEKLKLKEGKKESVLDGIPNHLPALIKAYRAQSKAGRVGFDWESYEEVFGKIKEELAEFEESVEKNDRIKIEEELGDILFSIVNLSRKMDVNPEDALRGTIKKFDTRFRYIEKSLKDNGLKIEETSLEDMDKLWEESKGKVDSI